MRRTHRLRAACRLAHGLGHRDARARIAEHVRDREQVALARRGAAQQEGRERVGVERAHAREPTSHDVTAPAS